MGIQIVPGMNIEELVSHGFSALTRIIDERFRLADSESERLHLPFGLVLVCDGPNLIHTDSSKKP